MKWVIDSDLIFFMDESGLSIHLLIFLVLSLDRYDGIQLHLFCIELPSSEDEESDNLDYFSVYDMNTIFCLVL